MLAHRTLTDSEVRGAIRRGLIRFAGNSRLRIYGKLRCSSGTRMLRRNRIFFASSQQARAAGYRPCGCCMNNLYQQWKNGTF